VQTCPAYCRPAAYEAFSLQLSSIDSPEGLLRAATAISLHEEPRHTIDETVHTVEQLALAVRRRLRSESEEAALAHLHDVMFDVIGFRGAEPDEYYDPANSYLPRVLQTRRGIPISLVLLYRSVAAQLGLRVEGVNAPGHFLAAATCREATGERVQYVDPFYNGDLLTREDALARIESATGQIMDNPQVLTIATPRAWLTRMLLNLQAIFARSGQQRDLLAMQELELLLSEKSCGR